MRDLAATRIRPPDRPGRSEMLCRLCYPGPNNIGAEYIILLQNALTTVGFRIFLVGMDLAHILLGEDPRFAYEGPV